MTVYMALVVYAYDYRGEEDIRLGVFTTEQGALDAARTYIADEDLNDDWHATSYPYTVQEV